MAGFQPIPEIQKNGVITGKGRTGPESKHWKFSNPGLDDDIRTLFSGSRYIFVLFFSYLSFRCKNLINHD